MRLRPMLPVIVLATPLISLAPIAGHAAETGPAVTASLRSVQPAAPQPGDELVLAGTIENTGDEPLLDVQAILRYSVIPLADRDDIRRVPIDDDVRWGQRYTDFFQEVDAELEPGETVEYRVPVPVDQLNLGTPGVYAVGVDIRGQPVDGERLTFATTRTVVPWLPESEALPAVPVAMLWPIETQPALLPDGTLLGDSLANQLAPDGSLTALVEVPGTAPVTWVVDPDVLATIGTMADGYAVTAPDGTTTEGTGATAAETWLNAFRTATDGADLLVLPYANPDLPAVARANEGAAAETAAAAVSATTDVTRQADLPGGTNIAWPGSGVADEATLAALASAGAETVVLAHDAVVGTSDGARAQVRAGDTTLDAVLIDGGLESAIAAAAAVDTAAGVTSLRQAWLAETAMTALAADSATAPTPLAVAPPDGWQPSTEIATALIDVWTTTPWVRPTALADLPGGDPPIVRPDPVATAIPPELPAEYVAAVADLGRDSADYAALLAEPDALAGELQNATLRALATAWRAAPEAGTAYTAAATSEVALRLGEVSILVPDSVTLSSKKGTFPLTISNGLPQPVLVSVTVTPDYPDRLSVTDVTPQRVEAGENATVEVTAEANANGRVPVTVRLTAADGSAFGSAQRMVVNATDYGSIGWVVIGVAVALFVAAAFLRLIRARRRPSTVDEPVSMPAESEVLRETAR